MSDFLRFIKFQILKTPSPKNQFVLSKRLLERISSLLLGILLFLPGTAHTQTENPQQQKAPRPLSLLVHAQYGYPFQYVSEILYENFQVVSLNLSLEKECGLWPFFGNKKLVESLLLEFRLSKIWGQDIPLVRDQVSLAVWNQAQQEGRRPTTNWDLYQVGLTPYYRLSYPVSPTIRVYGEAGLGITLLNKTLIEEGTLWNFLLTGGLGLDWKIKNQHFYSFVRFEHFSNGGKLWKEGLTESRVIGPETIVFGIGMRFPLKSP
jgi:Lipid A 3-O-deacylase (PagL)